ncbi:MAG: bifunctional hydroxymethylpyrimidine kinase/phosphomethylpyrimidine kinase [Thermoplasmata archaeon]|nr:bifunctional hydroxymethylpyrimidine kinase/phosphomethylpyrimidine kinase [Thermoplasmata archaeon]
MTNILTVAGSDPVAGAGIQADLKAIEALGMHACTVITCITAQNTKGVFSISPVSPEEVDRQLESVLTDVSVNAVKTGMLFDAETVRVVSNRIRSLDVPVVVDPVMRATTGGSLHSKGLADELRSQLLPLATLVTPNVHEVKALTGVSVKDPASVRRAARSLTRDGARAVLIKGGHMRGRNAIDYLFCDGRMVEVSTPRVRGDVHGTGCVLSSMIATYLSTGTELEQAVRASKAATFKAILSSERIGGGVPCANPLSLLRQEAMKAGMLVELDKAVAELQPLMDSRLLPEVGSNMGYAVIGALEPQDVAAFTGRITRVGDHAEVSGCARFGASKHVARIVLAASAKDPSVRCALNIKYSARTVRACREAGLIVASFDRSHEPRGASSMTWGVTYAIKRQGRVPDVIFDRGGQGKEPMIRLLAGTPAEVVEKLRSIHVRLD